MADEGEIKSQEEDLSPDIKDWSKLRVRLALELKTVDDAVIAMGVTFGPAKLIIHVTLKKEEPERFRNQPGRPCKPYPFYRYHDTYNYTEGNILDITESGPLNYIEPCHEYKGFTNTTNETKMIKFIYEVIRFAAACMNSRTNGTIHLGIGDKPNFIHGQVLGVVVEDKEAYANELKSAIDRSFEFKHKQAAQMCIKPPRFVGVLNKHMRFSDKCVIEVDIVPESVICGENIYHTFNMDTKKAKKKEKGKEEKSGTKPSKQFFIRDGGSSRNLLATTTSAKPMEEYNRFVNSVAKRSQLRKRAEENIKSSNQGSRLEVDCQHYADLHGLSRSFFTKVHQPQCKQGLDGKYKYL
ncbi:sterile alpha motif domain-containing protein 9-like, partial [Scomber scombrus]